MKYVVCSIKGKSEMFQFSEQFNHDNQWLNIKEAHPEAQLVTAGKLHIEPCDCYPGEHYVHVRPGSTTLKIDIRSNADWQQHYALAFPLIGAELPFRADGSKVFAGAMLPPWGVDKSRHGVLRLDYLPDDGHCPRARVTLEGLPKSAAFEFWQAYRQM